MSPHILIDLALESVAQAKAEPGTQVLVQGLITRLYADGAITTEEFSHYCKRLIQHCQRGQDRP